MGLLTEQIEFADVVVLNKVDAASSHEIELAKSIIRALNADARIIPAVRGDVPITSILDTGLFDFEAAHRHPLWYRELAGLPSTCRKPKSTAFRASSTAGHSCLPSCMGSSAVRGRA